MMLRRYIPSTLVCFSLLVAAAVTSMAATSDTSLFGPPREIWDEARGATSVIAVDLDNDGDLDLASSSNSDFTIAWYRNNGSGSFTPFDITTDAQGAKWVTAADLDNDGDIDLASASNIDDTIAWYRNNGSGSFTPFDITTDANGAQSVTAADLDGDGDIDLASASDNDDTIAWYRNNGSGSFTPFDITTAANGAAAVIAADLDGDGDKDLASANYFDNAIVWFENLSHGFSDVPTSGWKNDAVIWMKKTGLTTGCSSTEFCPEDAMTREQQITFLYRYAGEPDPGPTNPFSDVPRGQYYSEAIDWAYNEGITNGVSPTSFGTGQAITRAQAVTFLHRQAGEPAPTVANPFVDVPAGTYYTDPVRWAFENGITTGTSPTTFAPNQAVTRVQFAAFLSRYDNLMD